MSGSTRSSDASTRNAASAAATAGKSEEDAAQEIFKKIGDLCTAVDTGNVTAIDFVTLVRDMVARNEDRTSQQQSPKRLRRSEESLESYLETHKKSGKLVLKASFRMLLQASVVEVLWKKSKFIPSKAQEMEKLNILNMIWSHVGVHGDGLEVKWKKSELKDYVVKEITSKMSNLRNTTRDEMKKRVTGVWLCESGNPCKMRVT
jgi:hypothetical protein